MNAEQNKIKQANNHPNHALVPFSDAAGIEELLLIKFLTSSRRETERIDTSVRVGECSSWKRGVVEMGFLRNG